MPKLALKIQKSAAIAIIFLLIGSKFQAPVFAYDASKELSILFLQTQIHETRTQLREALNREDLSRGLESLQREGEQIFIYLEDADEKTYESRLNMALVSVIGGLRDTLNRSTHPEAQLKAATILLQFNQKLLGILTHYTENLKSGDELQRQEAEIHLKELIPIFVVLNPVALNLKHPDAEVRSKMFENFELFNRFLVLLDAEKNASLTPYLQAMLPALKTALKSEDAPKA